MTGLISKPFIRATLYTIGDTAILSNDAEASTTSYPTYVKLREITITQTISDLFRAIAVRMKFDMRSTITSIVQAEIRRNGVLIGANQSTSTTGYVTKSQDISTPIITGDTLGLWGIGGTSYSLYVCNFRICGSVSVQSQDFGESLSGSNTL